MEPLLPRDGDPSTEGWGTPFPRDGNRFVSGWLRPSINMFDDSDAHLLSFFHDVWGGQNASPTPAGTKTPTKTVADRPPGDNHSIVFTQPCLDLIPVLELTFGCSPSPHPVRNSGTCHRLNPPLFYCRRKEYSAFTISDGRLATDPWKFGKSPRLLRVILRLHFSNALRL